MKKKFFEEDFTEENLEKNFVEKNFIKEKNIEDELDKFLIHIKKEEDLIIPVNIRMPKIPKKILTIKDVNKLAEDSEEYNKLIQKQKIFNRRKIVDKKLVEELRKNEEDKKKKEVYTLLNVENKNVKKQQLMTKYFK